MMGSVVVSDVVSDIARYPPSMMVSDHSEVAPAAHTTTSYSSSSSSSSSSSQRDARRSSRPQRPAAAPEDTRSNSNTNTASAPTLRGTQDSVTEGQNRRSSQSQLQHSQAKSASHSQNSSQLHSQSQSFPPSPQLLPTLRSSLSLSASGTGSPARIKVRDLSHIQAFASEEALSRSQPRTVGSESRSSSLRGRLGDGSQQYEISSMPVSDIIEMVAGLLTRITTTNDRQHHHHQEDFHRHLTNPEGTSAPNMQTASVLSFHGKNVPSITILSYLSRIHKYCPTTYEVFLSLLVYFDRMTESINKGTLKSFRSIEEAFRGGESTDRTERPVSSDSNKTAGLDNEADLVDSDGEETPGDGQQTNPGHVFVVDSYNIHRLVIAGVTCASKFFSDVFYTNSRYAKVGGLPIHELNHLELQFLLLNDFRLSVPVEELEAYGSMLVEFYAQEVVAQQLSASGTNTATGGDALYMSGSGS